MLTREEWLRRINDPDTREDFAGTSVRVPSSGDQVRIVRGRDVGHEYTVVAVRGNVYRLEQQVFIDHPSGIPTWYYPWDLEVIVSGGPLSLDPA